MDKLKFRLLSLTFVFINISYGQENHKIHLSVAFDDGNNTTLFTQKQIDEAPGYKGGVAIIEKHLQTKIRYSKKEHKAGVEGKNYFKAIIDPNGKLLGIFCIKATISSRLVKQIENLIMECTEWKSAMKNGNPVESSLVILVIFKSTT